MIKEKTKERTKNVTTIRTSLINARKFPSLNEQSTLQFKQGIKAGKSNILVAVRVRPSLKKEIDAGIPEVIRVVNKKIVIVDPGVDKNDVLRVHR